MEKSIKTAQKQASASTKAAKPTVKQNWVKPTIEQITADIIQGGANAGADESIKFDIHLS